LPHYDQTSDCGKKKERGKEKELKNKADDHASGSQPGRSALVAVLLMLAVMLSAGSGVYAGASLFAQRAPNATVTTSIYTTTTIWTTSTIWPTLTSLVYGQDHGAVYD